MENRAPANEGHPASEPNVSADEITCRQLVELVTDYFEGALPPRTLSHVEEHLVMCDWCVAYVEQMRATIDSLRSLKQSSSREPPGPLLAALRANGGSAQ